MRLVGKGFDLQGGGVTIWPRRQDHFQVSTHDFPRFYSGIAEGHELFTASLSEGVHW